MQKERDKSLVSPFMSYTDKDVSRCGTMLTRWNCKKLKDNFSNNCKVPATSILHRNAELIVISNILEGQNMNFMIGQDKNLLAPFLRNISECMLVELGSVLEKGCEKSLRRIYSSIIKYKFKYKLLNTKSYVK